MGKVSCVTGLVLCVNVVCVHPGGQWADSLQTPCAQARGGDGVRPMELVGLLWVVMLSKQMPG